MQDGRRDTDIYRDREIMAIKCDWSFNPWRAFGSYRILASFSPKFLSRGVPVV